MSIEKKRPLISIVTVVFNGEIGIRGTIESCINQNFNSYEYIIIDGNSTDSTLSIVEEYKEYVSGILSEPDNGIYYAMNKGINLARGEWIIFMNCGDTFIDFNVLSKISAFCKELDNNVDVIYGNTVFKFPNYSVLQKPYSLRSLKRIMAFCHQSTFVRTQIVKEEPFDLRFRFAADFEMMHRLYNEKKIFKYLDIPISIFDQTDGTTIRNYKESIKERFLIYRDLHPIFNKIYCFWAIKRMQFGLFRKSLFN